MAKKVFFSFYFDGDCQRAAQVRNIGAIEGNQPVSSNDWEAVKNSGDAAVERWIDDNMRGRSCTVVLIGSGTAGRKWIDYEIKKTWADNKGLVGVYIHNLKDLSGAQSYKGSNPFASFNLNGTSFDQIVKAHDPTGLTSRDVYASIALNLESWIDEAIKLRAKY
jgi:hypothetical protein